MSFILLLILFIILWPLVQVLWKLFTGTRDVRRFMRDPEGFMRNRQQQSKGYAQGPQQKQKRKKIDPSEGEYIEFTEIETAQSSSSKSGTEVKYTKEEQITDIEWKDL